MSVLEPVRPRVLATQFIPNLPPGLHQAYKFAPEQATTRVLPLAADAA